MLFLRGWVKTNGFVVMPDFLGLCVDGDIRIRMLTGTNHFSRTPWDV